MQFYCPRIDAERYNRIAECYHGGISTFKERKTLDDQIEKCTGFYYSSGLEIVNSPLVHLIFKLILATNLVSNQIMHIFPLILICY